MMGMYSGGLPVGMGLLHFLFCLAFLIGLVLFVVWLVQVLNKKKQLLGWAIGLLVIGIIGVLLTFQFLGFGMMRGFGNNSYQSMIDHMSDEEHDEFTTADEFREHMLEEMQEHMGF